ncbi:MAG: hypothetical protein AAFP85_18675 [Pseudomonadota bacterium]
MITIPENDHGQIRVFATDAPLPPAAREKTPEGLAALFGATLDPTYVDIVRISDLGDMTLSAYIAEGYDMTADAVDKATVDGITGTAILILSRATAGQETTLTLAANLKHVTTYSPTAQITPPEPLPDASAKGTMAQAPDKPPKSDARIGGMVAMYALIFMFVFVGVLIWIAG